MSQSKDTNMNAGGSQKRPSSLRGNIQDRMKHGKTFYKGRQKQIDRDRNPSQWSAYDKAPRVRKQVQHFNPLADQLIGTRTDGILSRKSLGKNDNDTNDVDNTDIDQVCPSHHDTILAQKSVFRLSLHSKLSFNCSLFDF